MSNISPEPPDGKPPDSELDLPAAGRRQLVLRIEGIKEQPPFDGTRFDLPNSLEQRQRARELRIQPVHLLDLQTPAGVWYIDRFTDKPINNQADLDALLNDHLTVDMIGHGQMVKIITDIFDAIARAWFSAWGRTDLPYENFTSLLEGFRLRAIEEGRRTCPDRLDWFERRPLPDANALIDTAAKDWHRTAREFELKRLAEAAKASGAAVSDPTFERRMAAAAEALQASQERKFSPALPKNRLVTPEPPRSALDDMLADLRRQREIQSARLEKQAAETHQLYIETLRGGLKATSAGAPFLEVEPRPRPPAPTPAPIAAPEPSSASDCTPVSKRGRPNKIPPERKDKVLKCRAEAAANGKKFRWREAAKVLYDVRTPTPQQVKDASNIIKWYVKSGKGKSPNK